MLPAIINMPKVLFKTLLYNKDNVTKTHDNHFSYLISGVETKS